MISYTFKLPEEQLDRLKQWSGRHGMGVSECLRMGIDQLLNGNGIPAGLVLSGNILASGSLILMRVQ